MTDRKEEYKIGIRKAKITKTVNQNTSDMCMCNTKRQTGLYNYLEGVIKYHKVILNNIERERARLDKFKSYNSTAIYNI